MFGYSMQRSEQLGALVLIAAISLSVSFADWVQRGMAVSTSIATSSVAAVILMFWAPMIVSYLITCRAQIKHWPKQYILFYVLMVVGCFSWGEFRALALPIQPLRLQESMLIALPWSAGIFLTVHFYVAQKAIKHEKSLRQQAEIKLLHSQLNPHFLFNSLNTISSFASRQPKVAEELIQHLSAILRYSLNASKKPEVSLFDEIVMLSKWCEIEQRRFGDNLKIAFNVDENLTNMKLPAMILQPLIENSIKHANVRPLYIQINIANDESGMAFEVVDNGIGYPDPIIRRKLVDGFGLAITQSRLMLELGAELALSNRAEGGALASFHVNRAQMRC